MAVNVERLKEYKARLVLFPRKENKPKNGDATKEEVSSARALKALKGVIVAAPPKHPAVTFTKLSQVVY